MNAVAAARAATARMTAAMPSAAERLAPDELLGLAAAALGLELPDCLPVRVFGRGSTHRQPDGSKSGGWSTVLTRGGVTVAEASGRDDGKPDVTGMEVRAITEGLLIAAAYGGATMPVVMTTGQEWVIHPMNKVRSERMREPVRLMREAASAIGLALCRPTADDRATNDRCMATARAVARRGENPQTSDRDGEDAQPRKD